MDTSGLDVPKLKSLVIEKWNSDPCKWPAKAMSMARVSELEAKLGKRLDSVSGFITCLVNVLGKTPSDLEDTLGVQKGAFASGVVIFRLNTLPKSSEFQLRGYTYLPNGARFDGLVLRRSDMQRPTYFDKNGNPSKFPPGLGVEQWEINPDVLIPATELERVPFGAKSMKWS